MIFCGMAQLPGLSSVQCLMKVKVSSGILTFFRKICYLYTLDTAVLKAASKALTIWGMPDCLPYPRNVSMLSDPQTSLVATLKMADRRIEHYGMYVFCLCVCFLFHFSVFLFYLMHFYS